MVKKRPSYAEAVLRPRAQHDVHRLVEALAILLLRDVVAAELRGAIAPAHADVEPALGDDIDERHLLGQPQRVMEGQDGGGEPDAIRRVREAAAVASVAGSTESP